MPYKNPVKRKEYAKSYYHNHIEQQRERRRKYMQEYRKTHPEIREKELKQSRNYNQTHKGERRIGYKKYRSSHLKQIEEINKKWQLKHPMQIKELWRKHWHKRKRFLGFDPLNEAFENSEAHHIDFECVIYIPRELHNSIRHNIWTDYNMTEINDKVFEWLEMNTLILTKPL